MSDCIKCHKRPAEPGLNFCKLCNESYHGHENVPGPPKITHKDIRISHEQNDSYDLATNYKSPAPQPSKEIESQVDRKKHFNLIRPEHVLQAIKGNMNQSFEEIRNRLEIYFSDNGYEITKNQPSDDHWFDNKIQSGDNTICLLAKGERNDAKAIIFADGPILTYSIVDYILSRRVKDIIIFINAGWKVSRVNQYRISRRKHNLKINHDVWLIFNDEPPMLFKVDEYAGAWASEKRSLENISNVIRIYRSFVMEGKMTMEEAFSSMEEDLKDEISHSYER